MVGNGEKWQNGKFFIQFSFSFLFSSSPTPIRAPKQGPQLEYRGTSPTDTHHRDCPRPVDGGKHLLEAVATFSPLLSLNLLLPRFYRTHVPTLMLRWSSLRFYCPNQGNFNQVFKVSACQPLFWINGCRDSRT
jgi:hypothetical protein